MPNLLARKTLRLPPVTHQPSFANQTKTLSSDQWQDEMVYLSQSNFAAIQHSLVDYARGSWLGGHLCDGGKYWTRLCSSQVCDELPLRIGTACRKRVRSSRHYSFSVLGLSIILTIGGIIQVLAFFLNPLLALLFGFRRYHGYDNDDFEYAYAEWQAGSTLQLQRMAQQGVKAGAWSRATALVPVTKSGDFLAVLDLSECGHPRHPADLVSLRRFLFVRSNKNGLLHTTRNFETKTNGDLCCLTTSSRSRLKGNI